MQIKAIKPFFSNAILISQIKNTKTINELNKYRDWFKIEVRVKEALITKKDELKPNLSWKLANPGTTLYISFHFIAPIWYKWESKSLGVIIDVNKIKNIKNYRN